MTSSTKKIAIFAASALMLSGGIDAGLWYMLAKGERMVQERTAERIERSAREVQLSTLQRVEEDTAADRAELRTFILGKDDVADFLELIEGAARKQGLTPKTRSVEVEKLEGTTNFEAIALALEFEGSYKGVTAMLPLIESLPYQLEVRSVSLERTGDEGATSLWRGILQLRVVKEKNI